MAATRSSFEATAHRRAFGDRVRALREERSWSQEVLADRAEVTREYISRIESGTQSVSLDVIVRVARGFGLSLSELFRGCD
ncbi:MAG TPA: helix-turn-helix transcriptional regulator [Mycobacteriales bacterium]|nr:helix-turn-helix transcriptional regulator [Mycobacteriales bacterium]